MLTIQEVCQELKLSRWTVARLIKEGKLRAVRVGGRSWRIPEEELERVRKEGTWSGR